MAKTGASGPHAHGSNAHGSNDCWEYNGQTMKVVIAPQAFKGNLSAKDAARAIARGVGQADPTIQCVLAPVADGGDGTVEVLVEATGGRFLSTQVTGPLGEEVAARWGVMGDGKTAVIEMALVSGLALVPPRRRDPRITTSYGTGQLIRQALQNGYRRIIVGLGGSATNDGGAGMAQALGAHFLDEDGREIPLGGSALARLASIDPSRLHPGLAEAEVTAATDVNNPLCGPTGASEVYGPQKGATPAVVKELDQALRVYADVLERSMDKRVADTPGAGAAGGLGAGLMAFADATLHSGIDLICEAIGFDSHLDGADLLITGEGRIDASTAFNKAPVGVAKRAKAKGVSVVALAGSLGTGYQAVYDHGIDAVVPISDRPMTFRESLGRTRELLCDATDRAVRLYLAGRQ